MVVTIKDKIVSSNSIDLMPKMCVMSWKPNLILMLTNIENSIKTMKAIVFRPKLNGVNPG